MPFAFLVGDHPVYDLITLLTLHPPESKQLLVHSRNVNNVAQIRASLLANRKDIKRKPMECGPKRMRNAKECMENLVTYMHEFDSLPFNPASPILHTIQSGVPQGSGQPG